MNWRVQLVNFLEYLLKTPKSNEKETITKLNAFMV